ncbi:MAG: isoleucine--tRNA ligase [Candidatus Micrarchaeaceae archaeon]
MVDMKKNEESVFGYWEESKVYERIRERNSLGKKYYFLEGPPYASGTLGIYHIWVYTIKDIVLRYRRYLGYNVHDRAGFDVHGLPIEHKVEEKLKLKSKAEIEENVGVENFINACKAYASENVANAVSIAKSFGISLDFKNAYLPSSKEYMDKSWQLFKKLYDKGLVYKAYKPQLYCPHCETSITLQGNEIEYRDETDPSIYVGFETVPAKPGASAQKIDLPRGTRLLIWTTTPWTLPANVSIAANPKALYVLAEIEGVPYVIAKGRLDSFIAESGKNAIVLKEFYGSELEGVHYRSPFEEEVPVQVKFRKYHRVLLDENFVSLSEGTGLVHMATGHGAEDYSLGRKNKIPVLSLLDQFARYNSNAGKFVGLLAPAEANSAMLKVLEEKGNLIFNGTVRHSYPHCWRCGSKLVFLSSEQWFINIGKIKKKLLRENDKVIWHPPEAKKWQAETLESSPDWCISRQRYWDIPIPIWTCGNCGEIEVIGSAKELSERSGVAEPGDLHRPSIDPIVFACRKCGGQMHRISDIFDVWYDSGVAHTASLSDEEFLRLFPAEFITESKDQLRGWFSTLLKTSVGVYGKSPFKEIVIGGIFTNERGEEMHRHLGNALSAQDILNEFTADGFRLWCSSHPRWQDLRFKRAELEEADRSILTLYNIGNLAKELSSLSGLDLKNAVRPSVGKLYPEDAWILSRLSTLASKVSECLDGYLIDTAVNALRYFIIEDFSRFYLKLAKQRAAAARKPELKRIAGIVAYVLRTALVLASPIIPFSTEYLYREMFSSGGSIFEEAWPKVPRRYSSEGTEKAFELAKEISASVLGLREKAGIKLKQPIMEATVEIEGREMVEELAELSGVIERYANVKSIKLQEGTGSAAKAKPLFQNLGPEFKENASAIAEEISKTDPAALLNEISKNGKYVMSIKEGVFEIRPEHFIVVKRNISDNSMQFSKGMVTIDTTVTKEIREELLAREVTRLIQAARKEMSLTKAEPVDVSIAADEAVSESIKKNISRIKSVTNARRIEFVPTISWQDNVKELEVAGSIIKLLLRKA